MFRAALAIANQFTFPVIISRKTVSGRCSSSIGTFVVVNEEGWILTAGHILRKWAGLSQEVSEVRRYPAVRASIEADVSIQRHEKKRRLASLTAPKLSSNERCSAFWNFPGVALKDSAYLTAFSTEIGDVADLGVGRLEPFDPNWVSSYPVFKDPTKDFEPGTSLCKQGFPFHNVTPTWDAETEQFLLPAEALPLPRFPIEGIFTRIASIVVEGEGAPKFPVKYVETRPLRPGCKAKAAAQRWTATGQFGLCRRKLFIYRWGLTLLCRTGKRARRNISS